MSTPIYELHGCPLCAARRPEAGKPARCADCNKEIPTEATNYAYKNMCNRGFQSHTSDHRHTRIVQGNVGFGEAKRELCLECYRLDFAKAYPLEAVPV